MVKGLDTFQKYFADYEEQYVLIGGAACDILFESNAEVEIINPVADTVATATFNGAAVDWYIKADDIVLKNKNNQNVNTSQNTTQQKK